MVSDTSSPLLVSPAGSHQLFLDNHLHITYGPKQAFPDPRGNFGQGRQKKSVDEEVGTITERFLRHGPSLKAVEGRKGLETSIHTGCLVQCETDMDRSLESMEKHGERMEAPVYGEGVSRCDS